MATATKEVQKAPQKGVAISDELKKMAAGDVGKGTSTAQEDNLIPLLYVLQGLSPQVNKRGEAYVEGAEPGDIWLRNAPKEIIKSEEGLIFQPCAFSKNWVEWVPREQGGGRRGMFNYEDMKFDPETKKATLKTPSGVVELKVDYRDGNTNVPLFKMPNGNDLVETRYQTGFAEVDGKSLPYVISFKSTGHTVAKEWMGKQLQHSQIDGKNPDPSWLYFYKLSTKMRKNKDGEWFVLQISDTDRVATAEEFQRGKSLYTAVMAGEKQIGEEIQEGSQQTEIPF
jgi:hypothetical protein